MKYTGVSGAMTCLLFVFSFTSRTSPTYEDLNAVLWVQTSIEYQASTLETYRSAEAALLRGLRDRHWTAALEQTGSFENLPPAVILDLDETVLNNAAFEAELVISGRRYSNAAWTEWIRQERSDLVPGARQFLLFAKSHGVVPLYVTDRVCDSTDESDSTVRILRKLGLPFDRGGSQLLCSRDIEMTNKASRRRECATKYRILLLIGDQLGDFVFVPNSSANLLGREAIFSAHNALWGTRWFQIPNPMYGSWEGAVGYTLAEKLSRLRQ